MIISIEGPDFVGKNTLVQLLITNAPQHFPGKKIKVLQFPNKDTEIGRMCRERLKASNWTEADAAIFQLLNTAHRYEYMTDLEEGKNDSDLLLFVVRYNLSGPVYAAVDGLDATHTWNLYAWFDHVLPDYTFVVFREYSFSDLTNERDPDHYEKEEKQKKVRVLYEASSVLWPKRLGKVHHIYNSEPQQAIDEMLECLRGSL